MVKMKTKARAVLKTSFGDIAIELLHDKAPRTCENFAKLAGKGFYDGLTFHRVLKDFMIQGGCPKGDGTGGPGYNLGPEFNDTPHVKGVVSMARSNDPHSAGSQFFIMHGEGRYLDHKYSAFGRVVEGEDVVDKIAELPVLENRYRELSQPQTPVYINRVELEGVEFDDDDLGQGGGRDRGRKPEAASEEPAPQEKARSKSKPKPTAKDEDAATEEDEDKAPKSKTKAKATRKRSTKAKADDESAKPAKKKATRKKARARKSED